MSLGPLSHALIPHSFAHLQTFSQHPNRTETNMEGFDVSQLFAVEGLVCVVTGGGTGIGLCIFQSQSKVN